jgi:hypothetical protein
MSDIETRYREVLLVLAGDGSGPAIDVASLRTTRRRRTRRTAAACGSALLAVAAVTVVAGTRPPTPPGYSRAVASPAVSYEQTAPAKVVQAVRYAETEGSVQAPVEWVETTTQRAGELTQDGPGAADVPIYLVQMRGSFVLDSAPRPPGASSPKGSVLVFLVPIGDDSKGGGGARLTNAVVDLSGYGTVHLFDPRS